MRPLLLCNADDKVNNAILIKDLILANVPPAFLFLTRKTSHRPKNDDKFKQDCVAIIDAAKSNNYPTVSTILKDYFNDEAENLKMHSLINAARGDHVELAEKLIIEHGVDPMAYNEIAIKQARHFGNEPLAQKLANYNVNQLVE